MITASEIVLYGAANHAEDDTSIQGGAIDLTKKVEMVPMAANDDLEAVSSDAGDTTQTLTITGRLIDGTIDTEVINLNGTTPAQAGAPKTFNRVLKAVLSAATAGTITLRLAPGGATVCTFEPGILEVRTLFYDAISLTTGPKNLYEKFFVRNDNASLALTQAILELTAEPALVSDFLMGVESALNGSSSVVNRLTAPTTLTPAGFVQLGVQEPVPGDSIPAAGAIGVWLQMVLAQDNVPVYDSWEVTTSGATI